MERTPLGLALEQALREAIAHRDSQYRKPYPAWICLPCGQRHGRRIPGEATWHPDTCGVCGREDVPVTEPRDFGHLRPGWDAQD